MQLLLPLILIVSALTLGFGIIRFLSLRLYRFEYVAMSILLGLFLWSWLALILSLLLPYRLSLSATVVISLVIGLVLWRSSKKPAEVRPLEGGQAAWWGWSLATTGTTALFGHLLWTHCLRLEATGLYSVGSTWADFGLHAGLISHFAASDRLPLDLPIAAGKALTYPGLIDFLSSTLVYAGWSLHLALFVPSLLLIWSLLQLFISLSLRLFRRLSAAIISLVLILANGSAVGVDAAWNDWRHSGLSLIEFLSNIPRNYSGIDQLNAHFNNAVADLLLPQRPFIFGLGVFLLAAILLQLSETQRAHQFRLMAAGLVGLLPLAHAHSFIAGMVLIGGLAVGSVHQDRRQWRSWTAAIGLGLAIALPQLLWQQLANGSGTGGHIALGWMWQQDVSIWQYWWTNFGVAALFLIALPLLIFRSKWRRYLGWYMPFLLLLCLTQLYSLQPFEYDNLKLIYYVYLMGCLFAGILIVEAVRRSRFALLFITPLVLAMTIPGSLTILREFQLHDQFASNDDIVMAQWVNRNTLPDSVFITTDRPNHPVLTLAGRTIVMGYRGWLYNYHIDYTSRQAVVASALQGHTIGRPFGARYLVVGQYEASEWEINRPSLEANYHMIYRNPEWTVYELPK